MTLAGILACGALLTVPQEGNLLDQIHVLQAARQVGLTAPQARRMSEVAKAMQTVRADEDKEVDQLLGGSPMLAQIVGKLIEGKELTTADQSELKRIEQTRQNLAARFRGRMDQQVEAAIKVLTDRQLFAIALRTRMYDGAFETANKIRTVSASAWPQFREQLAFRLTERAYLALYNEGVRQWEQATGKRSDVRGSGFSIAATGMAADLERIRQEGRDRLQKIRDAGAPKESLAEVAATLLQDSIRILRTWPPNPRDMLAGMPDGTVSFDPKSDTGEYGYGRLLESFIERLLKAPRASETLEKLAAQGSSLRAFMLES